MASAIATMLLAGLAGVAACAGARAAAPADVDDLLALSLEELGEVPVTSATHRPTTLADVAASVYVIDGADIRASGARSLPEALRLAPNLHVARTDARGYAISARGLKTTLSNKLLVLIDGRPVYTPMFSGVLWDQQDTLVEDIARIEVISGPGASVWGSNAVNGVINVITRSSRATVGGFGAVYAGERHRGVSARLGWAGGPDSAGRIYARHGESRSTSDAAGDPVGDGWTQTQVGFASDLERGGDAWRLQGDAFRAESDPRPAGPVEVTGYNLLGRWVRALGDGGSVQVQGFVDAVDRADPLVLFDRMRIVDLRAQHARMRGSHLLVWGGGYRHADDDSRPGAFARMIPAARTLEWAHLFVEDTIEVSDRLQLDLGLRAESNSYTGVEVLPNARLAWRFDDGALAWGSASRAVRAPARFDRDLFFPAEEPFLIRGGSDFEAEVAQVLELGYRAQPTARLAYSLTAFHHWYDGLRGGRPAPQGGVQVANRVDGRSYGIEAWATLRVPGEWEVALGLLELRQRLSVGDGGGAGTAVRDQGNDPEHQAMLRVSRRLPHQQHVFVHARHVSALPDPHIPAYTAVDARWSWQPTPSLEIGIGVENALDEAHAEFAPRAGYAQSVFGRAFNMDLRLYW